MPYGLYLSAAGADAQARRVEALSHNMANASTPGFKRELTALQAIHSEAIEQGLVAPGSGGRDDISGGVQLQETLTHFARGPLNRTENDTDFAVDSDDGFFLVEKDGQPHLTRAGNFVATADGFLRTQDGYAVLSTGGEPISLDWTQPWTFNDAGYFQQEGSQTPIAVVQPHSLGDLVRVGDNVYRPLGPFRQLVDPQERPRVLNGHLEMSGVKPTTEMMELIEATRAYEANVRMIQNQDSMLGSLISRALSQ